MSDRINVLSKKIVEKFSYYKIIEDDQEVYEFGLRELLWNMLHIVNILIVGFLTNRVVYLLIIFSFYCPVRVYAGGYHADTRKGCYIGTILLSIFLLKTFEFLYSINIIFIITLTLLLSIVIFFASPQESPNNTLTTLEKKKYKKKVLIILVFEAVLILLTFTIGYKHFIYILSTSIISVFMTMMLGILKKSMISKII